MCVQVCAHYYALRVSCTLNITWAAFALLSYTQITQLYIAFIPLSFSIKKSECTSPPPYFLSQHSHVPFTTFSLSML